MILLGLDFGGVLFPWSSAKIIALLVVGGCMIFAFIYSEAKVAKYPLIPMTLFRRRTNVAAFLVVFFHGFVSLRILVDEPVLMSKVGLHQWRILPSALSSGSS
jgi:hypothetical protein